MINVESFIFLQNDFLISALPVYCKTFKGPHDIECLQYLWNVSGCLPDGYMSPVKLSTVKDSDQLLFLNDMNLE